MTRFLVSTDLAVQRPYKKSAVIRRTDRNHWWMYCPFCRSNVIYLGDRDEPAFVVTSLADALRGHVEAFCCLREHLDE